MVSLTLEMKSMRSVMRKKEQLNNKITKRINKMEIKNKKQLNVVDGHLKSVSPTRNERRRRKKKTIKQTRNQNFWAKRTIKNKKKKLLKAEKGNENST